MNAKSPEQYFQDQNFSPDSSVTVKPGEFSAAERAFVEKYMGLDSGVTLRKLGIEPPIPRDSGKTVVAAADPPEESLDSIIRRTPELLMVGFFVGEQEFVVPTLAVQEVIRYIPPTKLPAAQRFVAGVVNLRGKVTPLIRLRDMLEIPGLADKNDQFTIICSRKGLQFGLMIEKVHTMYRVPQSDIDWNVETHLGSNAGLIAGLLKQRGNLLGIVSVDKIIEILL